MTFASGALILVVNAIACKQAWRCPSQSVLFQTQGETTVANSVLDAIKMGIWDYEPENTETEEYNATAALPGTDEKLDILAQRVQDGLPLWHPRDRRNYEDTIDDIAKS